MRKIHLIIVFLSALLSAACGNSSADESAWELKLDAAHAALDSGDVAAALPALMDMREQAAKEKDDNRGARAAMMLSEMYEDCGAYESGLALAREAAAKFEESGDSASLTEMRIRLASLVDDTEGLALMKQVLSSDSVPEVSRLVAHRWLAYSYYKGGKLAEAEEIYTSIIAANKDYPVDRAYLGMILLAKGRVDEALAIDSGLHGDFPVVQKFKSELYKCLGRYEDAIRAMERANAFRREYYSDIQSRNLIGSLSDYYEANRKLREKELRYMRMILWLVVVSVVSVSAALALLFARYRRRKNEAEEANLRAVSELQEACSAGESERNAIREAMHRLLRERYRVLDEVCLIAWSSPDDKVARKAISNKMTELIATLASDKNEFGRLEDIVNEHYSGVLDELKQACPNLKDVDRKLYVFTALGFSAGAVALLLGIDKVSIVYDRKRRLKARLLQLPGGDALVEPIS
ncbi:MAG: hypothetical protein K2L21_01080 [Muribaculaceae bacterium]|nr:hypothetical protein [Muribaculaceae bacterium]